MYEAIYKVYGQVAAIMISQFRWKAVFVSLPIVALLPVYFALIFGLKGEGLKLMLTGAVISPSVWISIGFIQDFVVEREKYKYIEMLIASPMRPSIYIISRLIASLLISTIYALPLIALYAYITGSIIIVIYTIGLISLLGLTLTPLSIMVSLKIRSLKEAGSLPSLISLFVTYLPPVYYEPRILPEAIGKLSLLIPSATTAEILRSMTSIGYDPLLDASALIVYLLIISLGGILAIHFKLNWTLD